MQVNIKCKPAYSSAFCVLTYGEELNVTRGAMMAMSQGFHVSTGVGSGGIGKAIMRRALGGETFFMAKYRAEIDSAWVAIGPPYPGDIEALEFDGTHEWIIEAGSLLAASSSLNVDVKYAGMRLALMDEGLTMLKVSGTGIAVVSSYGGMITLELDQDEVLIVDTGHLVGFTSGIGVKLGIVGGVVTTTTAGEGLVSSLRGPGKVMMQTRSEIGTRGWLMPPNWENISLRQ